MDDDFYDYEDGLEVCNKLIKNNTDFLIEEKLYGEEFSLFTITDGKNIVFIHQYKIINVLMKIIKEVILVVWVVL